MPLFVRQMSGRSESYSDSSRSSASGYGSSSSDYDSQDARDDREVSLAGHRGKLQLESKRSQSSSSSSDMEDDDGEHLIRSRVRREKNAFLVDDEGRNLETKVTEVTAAANPYLDQGNLEQAFKVFGTREVAERQAHQVLPVGLEDVSFVAKPVVLNDDEFERECDRLDLQEKLIDHARDWMMEKYFKDRDPRLADDENGDEYLEQQHSILRAILSELCGYGSDSVQKVPEFVIKYRSDLYDVENSIFNDGDVYSIREHAKKYAWLIQMRKEVFSRLQKAPVTYHDSPEMEAKWKECKKVIDERITEIESFNDIRRYLEYLDTSDKRSTHVSFFKQRELFGKMVGEFLMHPNVLTMNIVAMSNDPSAQMYDPPEPSQPPVQFFEAFFDENPRYAELCEAEAQKATERARAKDEDLDDEVSAISILEEKIVKYAAEELAVNPYLLYQLREQITAHMVVNTEPTAKGNAANDLLPFGKYGPIKRLKGKPTSSFAHTDIWLLISEARGAGYITVTIDLDYEEGGRAKFFELLASIYRSHYNSSYDSLRERVVEKAFNDHIWPQFVAETETDLMKGASDFVKDTVEELLFKQLTAPPFVARSDDLGGPKKSGVVLSFCYHPDFPRDLAVALVNSDGIVEKWQVCDSIVLTSRAEIRDYSKQGINRMLQDKQLSSTERNAIKIKADIHKLLAKKKNSVTIDVVVVAATCLKSESVYNFAHDMISSVETRKSTPIIFAPADAALVYARAAKLSAKERRDLSQSEPVPDMIIVAASVARRVQNPLSELTRLCTPERNYLAGLPLHPFQSSFISDAGQSGPIEEACQRACLKAVGISGVDIFKLHSDHHRGPLQFVPGLGPVWAEQIIAKMSTKISNRERLCSEVFGDKNPTIKTNAIGFIRFPATIDKKDRNKKNDETQMGNLLDGTLIHVNDYGLANNLIRFKMEKGPRSAIQQKDAEEFFKEPQHFTEDELISFCEAYSLPKTRLLDFVVGELSIGPYQSLRFEPRRFDIPREDESETLNEPYGMFRFRDNRRKIAEASDIYQYCPLTDQELFDLLVNNYVFAVGDVSDFRILSIRSSEIRAEHESGLQAIDTRPDGSERDFARNSHHPAVTIRVDIRHLRLEVSFRKDDIDQAKQFQPQANLHWRPTRALDKSFDLEGEEKAHRDAIAAEKNKPHRYSTRNINDEHYREINYAEAKASLLEQKVGSFLFRPSAKGVEHLSLNVKFPGMSVASYDIVERKKQGENDLTLGKELYIERLKFSELEEIVWSFIEPLTEQLNEVIGHRKWVEDLDEAKSMVLEDYRNDPRTIPYRLTVDPAILNCVAFIWLYGSKLVIEPIRPTSAKFRYRHTDFERLEQVINYWKQVACRTLPSTDRGPPIERMRSETEERREREKDERMQRDARDFGRGPRRD